MKRLAYLAGAVILVASFVATKAPATSAVPWYSVVESSCGRGTLATTHRLGLAIIEDEDTGDNSAEVADSRKLIRLADECEAALPTCTNASNCDDAPSVFMGEQLLIAFSSLSPALAATGQPGWESAFDRYILEGIELCNSPHITNPQEPYKTARLFTADMLQKASTLSATHTEPTMDANLDKLQACAARIGAQGVSF
jgi:hypothetical protein